MGLPIIHLSSTQCRDFDRDGFVVARSLLSPAEDLQPLMDEYDQALERVAQRMHRNGELSSTFANLPFTERVIAITREAGVIDSQPFDISLPIGGNITPKRSFISDQRSLPY